MATLENPFPIMKAMCWLPKWFASFPGLGLRVWGFGFSDSGLQGGACYNPKPHASKKEVLTILALLPRALKTRSSGTKNEALTASQCASRALTWTLPRTSRTAHEARRARRREGFADLHRRNRFRVEVWGPVGRGEIWICNRVSRCLLTGMQGLGPGVSVPYSELFGGILGVGNAGSYPARSRETLSYQRNVPTPRCHRFGRTAITIVTMVVSLLINQTRTETAHGSPPRVTF